MTNQQHPITPPPGLVEQWHSNSPLDRGLTLATKAAQWGADQELEACCQVIKTKYGGGSRLRAARRPKPPSLKKQALAALERRKYIMDEKDLDILCRAVGALPE
jgi:hypothetical protein